MNKLLKISVYIIATSFILSSCSMKECQCISTTIVTENGAEVDNFTTEVHNSTRGECEDFNTTDDIYQIDSTRVIHKTLICHEE